MTRSKADAIKREQQKKEAKTPGKSGGVANNGTAEGTAKKAAEGDAGTRTSDASCKDAKGAEEEDHKGAKKALRRAVKVEVKKRRAEIATSLVNKTTSGDMRGATILLNLIDKSGKHDEDEGYEGMSTAEMLASEPEWDEDEDDSAAVDVEGRKPVGVVAPENAPECVGKCISNSNLE